MGISSFSALCSVKLQSSFRGVLCIPVGEPQGPVSISPPRVAPKLTSENFFTRKMRIFLYFSENLLKASSKYMWDILKGLCVHARDF